MKKLISITILTLNAIYSTAQLVYPYPIQSFDLNIEGKQVKMAFMDIKPVNDTTTKAIVLLHGKNFNGYYWKHLIPWLTSKGYRVVVPDQVGWGQSDRVPVHFSFHLLAANTKQLLQSLGINKTIVLGHSMGGMLAIRFALMYPEMTDKLILENPIGLEDYKIFVPYQSTDSIFLKERSATYESYKKYQQSYYPLWKPEYEEYVAAQAADLKRKDFDNVAFINALTYQMIYQQPVYYEFDKLTCPVLLVIGQADRTIVGKDKLSAKEKEEHGNYPVLGKNAQERIHGSTLKMLNGVGHIPHVQDINAFVKSIEDWLK